MTLTLKPYLETHMTLTLKHKFYLDLKKLKFIFKSMLILCLFMSNKLLMDGQTKTIVRNLTKNVK